MAGIDKALLGADGIGADDQPLQYQVRIPRENGPVHERPRLALVAVDDDIFLLLPRIAGGLPF